MTGYGAPIKRYTTDALQATLLQERHDSAALIKDKELFWALFCKTMCETGKPKLDLSFIQEKDLIVMNAREHAYGSIREAVEGIRQLFERGFNEKRSICILPIHPGVISNYSFIIEPSPNVIDLTHAEETILYTFIDVIRPAMAPLAKKLGAICTPQRIAQKIVYATDLHTTVTTDAFCITWDKKKHLIYPIPPQKPEEGPELCSVLYEQYKQQKLCDFTLVDREGRSVKLHSVILHTYGGESFQKLLTNAMQEKESKTITFPEYSIETLELFAEYLYLGAAAFAEALYAKETADGAALFEFASNWQVLPLIDCATNLISVADIDKEDLESINALAERYNNKHLKQLVAHFKEQQPAPLEAGVEEVD